VTTHQPKADLTAQHVVVKARSTVYDLAARLILSPSDPALHEEMAAYLAGEGAEAMAAMRELEALTVEEVEARLKQVGDGRARPARTMPWERDVSAQRPGTPAGWDDEPEDEAEPEFEDDVDELEDQDEEAPGQPEDEQLVAGTAEVELADDDDAWLREYDKLAALAEGQE
jgi:hypothetical protein